MAALLETQLIHKAYGGNPVLRGISLSVEPGEIISIIGENGAGKSTLAKIVAGVVEADSGTLLWENNRVSFSHPLEAIQAGIGMVHQELNLAENLTVRENLMLGREETRFGLLTRGAASREAEETLKRLAPQIRPGSCVAELSTGQRQFVEIARALSLNAKLLIFDEPTSSLSEFESAQLLKVIQSLKSRGVSVIYVSHRLSEVLEISDVVYSLRDGVLSGSCRAGEADRDKLVRMMIGRELRDLYPYRVRQSGAPLLQLDGFRATTAHTPCSMTLHAGEIVGIAGLMGSGRTELLEAIFGLRELLAGTVSINGKALTIKSPSQAAQAGIGFVSESRKDQGLFLENSITENIILSSMPRYNRGPFRQQRREGAAAAGLIEELAVRCQSPNQPVGNLSGGNQQKVVVARWLATHPRILLLDEPTRGVDIGARSEIYELLFKLAEQGLGILFVSSELEEVMGIADRIMVMNQGRLHHGLARDDFSEHAVMTIASQPFEKAA